MRVTLVCPHFWPETGAAAQRITSLAIELSGQGFQVHLVTTLPHHPAMRIPDEYDVPTPYTQTENGVTVTRLRPRLTKRGNLLDRLLGEASFAVAAGRLAGKIPADVVIASSPYFLLGPAGHYAARQAKAAFVWDVRDLTWLYPKATGKRTYGMETIFDRWMRRVAKRADALVTTSQAQLNYLRSDDGASKVIPNGVTPEEITLFGSLGAVGALPARPRITYVGLFGFMHGLATLVDVAALVPECDFHFYGDGPERPGIEAKSNVANLPNVYFHGHVNKQGVLEAYRAANILVAPVLDRDVFRMIQPAKIWEYLATGRPVIHAGNGESAAILIENELAWVVPPEEPAKIAAAIRQILGDFGRTAEITDRARRWVAANRNRQLLATEWSSLLREIVPDA